MATALKGWTAALILGLFAASAAAADAGNAPVPFTRPAALPPPPAFSSPPPPPAKPAIAPTAPANPPPDFNLLGKPDTLSPEQRKLGQDVRAALQLGHQAAADQLLSDYLQNRPHDPKALLLKAVIQRSGLEPADATALFTRVAELSPDSPEGQAAKAMINDKNGADPEAALWAYLALTPIDNANHDLQLIQWLRMLTAVESGRLDGGQQMAFGDSLFGRSDQPLMSMRLSANLFDEKEMSSIALISRNQAVQAVPAGWTYRELAMTQLHNFTPKDAEASIKKATDLDPQNIEGWLDWAQILSEGGKVSEALEKIQHAAEIDPQSASVQIAWAQTLCNSNDSAGAVTHARLAITLTPQSRNAHTMMGRALDKAGDPDAAKWQFEIASEPANKISNSPPVRPKLRSESEILDMSPAKACTEIMNNLAAGDERQAQDTLDRLLQKFPDQQDVNLLDGVWLFPSIITDDQGKDRLARAAAADPNSETGKFAALMLKSINDHVDKASFQNFCKMAESHDHDALYLWAAAMTAVDRDDVPRQLEFFNKLARLSAVGPQSYNFQYARAFEGACDFTDALPHIELSVHQDAGGWNYVTLGWTLGKLRQFQDADAAFARGLPYAEQFAYRWYDWGHVLMRWGHFDDAITKLIRAANLDPNDDLTYQDLMQSLSRLGKTEHARDQWHQVIGFYQAKGDTKHVQDLQSHMPKDN